MNIKLLGERIKLAREKRGFSLDTLAAFIKLNKSTISRYERGEIERPKMPVIQAIGNSLGVDPMWLIGKTDDMSYTPPYSEFMIGETTGELFENLKVIRKSRSVSPQEIAFEIGISTEDYLKIEEGRNTDCKTLRAIALYLGCNIDDLVPLEFLPANNDEIPFYKSSLFKLHQIYPTLSEENQEKVLAFARNLKEEGSCKNIVSIAARNGNYSTVVMNDKQLSDVLAIVNRLPDAAEDL